MKKSECKQYLAFIKKKMRYMETNAKTSLPDLNRIRGMIELVQKYADVPLKSPILTECRDLIAQIDNTYDESIDMIEGVVENLKEDLESLKREVE